MKQKLLCMILCLMLVLSSYTASLAEDIGVGLQVRTESVQLTRDWMGNGNDTHSYIVIPTTLINWEKESIVLPDRLQAKLTYADSYEFSGDLYFDSESIDPLVELNGNIVLCVPNMVTEHLENASLQIVADGKKIDLPVKLSEESRSQSNTFEGSGYDTPQEAVLAYIDAMRENDVAGMISTFAIETMVDHIDTYAYLDRIRMAHPISWQTFPLENNYTIQLAVYQRLTEIIKGLAQQNITYSSRGTEYAEAFAENASVRLESVEDVDSFIAEMSSDRFVSALQTCEFVEWIDSNALSELYNNEKNQENIDRTRKCYGMDEICHLNASLRMGGKDWLLFMECGRYGDKWYNSSLAGNVALLYGLNSYAGGLLSLDAYIETWFKNLPSK